MRIAVHSLYYPPEVGGLESHVHDLSRTLVRRGHSVEVVTTRSLPDAPRTETLEGVRVRRTWFPARNPAGWALASAAALPAVWGAARRAQVLHAHTFASGFTGAVARSLAGVPLVLTLHTSHFLRRAESPAWRPPLGWLLRRADRVLATSAEIRDAAGSLAPGVEVTAITNAVDVERFRPRGGGGKRDREGERLIVVPRRLFRKNGVEYLIRALPAVRRQLPVRARLVGDGPERRRLERLVEQLDVGDSVEFAGARPHGEMPAVLVEADAVVIPSLVEATSVAALEAMACGIPVAASRVGGLPEIVDEAVGTLFRPGDPRDLAEKLSRLLRRPDREEMGRRARRRVVERWSLDGLAERHETAYREVIGAVGTGGEGAGGREEAGASR